jgi:hypothetical protein
MSTSEVRLFYPFINTKPISKLLLLLARRFRHFLLGGAIALFGLSFLGMSCMDDYDVFDNNNVNIS